MARPDSLEEPVAGEADDPGVSSRGDERDGSTAGEQPRGSGPTRRAFVVGGAAIGAAGALGAARPARAQARLIEQAAAFHASRQASLSDIEHVVILMQENRAFDHYFGTMSSVRGFSDPAVPTQTVGGKTYPIFDQFGYQPGPGPDPSGYLQPFNLKNDPPTVDGETTNDIDHTWPTQHLSWNNGALDGFITAHLAADGTENAPLTMGYFTGKELAFYFALADAFTVCDGYFCSVLGPTDPNRLMAMSAWIDPDGTAGGPVVQTFTDRVAEYGALSWKTMPEALLSAGASWKVYNDPLALLALSPLPYFKAYNDPFSLTGIELIAKGLTPTYPGDFAADAASGSLPAVSWIMSPLAECEHPAAPPEYGEYLVRQVLGTLVSNPDVWAHTVLFVVYDENGGFFDHVPPPTAPAGTAGEYLTTLPSAAGGIAGPIGLGFRTPCLVISPFSRGGYRRRGMRTRIGAAVLTGAALLATGAGTAGPTWTVSPGGAITATDKSTLTDTVTGTTLTCRSRMSGTLRAGTGLPGMDIGSIATATYTCAGPLPFTLTAHGLPWHLSLASYDSSTGVSRGTVGDLRFTIAGSGCTAVVNGTSGAAPDGVVRVSYANTTGALKALTTGGNLHWYHVNGCAGLIGDGDAATLSASYTVSPKQVITSP
jgi:phospholipase C